MDITLTWEPYEHAYAVRFAYNARMVGVVKELPYSYRRWDSVDRCWYVELWAVDELVGKFRRHAWTPTFLRRHDDPEPATEAADRSWAVVLMEAVGPQRREAVFRALTRVLHPDVTGGDTTLQQQLNEARDAFNTEERNAS